MEVPASGSHGRTEVRWRRRQETSLTAPGSKFSGLQKALLTLLRLLAPLS